MTRNVHISRSTGRFYDVHSYDVVDRRSIPTKCHECGEMMYQEDSDDLRLYTVLVFGCRNGHHRTVYVEKEV